MLIIITKLKHNLPGFWQANRWFIIFFIMALLCDAASTSYFMQRQGPDVELHPVIRLVSQFMGPYLGPLLGFLGKAVAGLIIGLYLRKWAPYIFITVTIISFWAAWYNIWGHKLDYFPNIFNLCPW
ncbi:MAG: hypothetical protein KAJ52_01855 [Sedimentisphaerales bacterium]|nr:hypothetical protein [Sedimentisphaerales bacterium]